ncbi:unnamed protein product [Bathycoccus prasinos]
MLRRSAVTFAERALASSSRTRTSKLATTAQKRGMAGGEGGVTHEGLTIHPAAPVHKNSRNRHGWVDVFWVMYDFTTTARR